MYEHLNTVSDHPLIPQEAFLFIPQQSQNQTKNDDFKRGEDKTIRRLIFEGWAQQKYTKYQKQKLKEFQDYLQRKNIVLDKRWNKNWKLRWLLSTGCNHKKCIEEMTKFINYQNSIQELHFTDTASKYLKQGVYYVAGRDSHYRPILVFDLDKVLKLKMNQKEVEQTQIYFFEYVLRNLLIPGQVENWVAIIDVGFNGMFSLMGSIKDSIVFLSNTYRSRMFVAYMVRCPTSMYFLWSIAKKFMEEQTIRKINFFDEQKIEPLLQYCHPSQLEEKFGGSLTNFQDSGSFWPPQLVSNQYKAQNQKTTLLSRQQYTDYFHKKILYETKFHEQNFVKPKPPSNSQTFKQNTNLKTLKHLEKQFKIQMECFDESGVEDFAESIQKVSKGGKKIDFQAMVNNRTKVNL